LLIRKLAWQPTRCRWFEEAVYSWWSADWICVIFVIWSGSWVFLFYDWSA